MPADNPTDEECLLAAIESRMYEMHTSMPATILAYDHATQKATVQPIIRARYFDAETETMEHYKIAAIPNVPVQFPQASGYSITFPLTVGDTVLLVFCERSLDEWLLTGNTDNENQDFRRFDLSDAVAIAGINPFVSPQTQVDLTSLVIAGAQIKLGSISAVEQIMLGTTYMTALSTYLAALEVYVDALGTALTALGATGMPALAETHTAAKNAFLGGNYLSLKVKAE